MIYDQRETHFCVSNGITGTESRFDRFESNRKNEEERSEERRLSGLLLSTMRIKLRFSFMYLVSRFYLHT